MAEIFDLRALQMAKEIRDEVLDHEHHKEHYMVHLAVKIEEESWAEVARTAISLAEIDSSMFTLTELLARLELGDDEREAD
jgi:hypothetical protein